MLESVEEQLASIMVELAALRAELAAVREMVATRAAPPPPANHPLRESGMWQCAGCGTWTPLGAFHTCHTVTPMPYNPPRVWCADGQDWKIEHNTVANNVGIDPEANR